MTQIPLLNTSKSPQILKVGLIGLGEVAQAVHLPTLSLLSHLFTVVAICDISPASLAHCSAKFHIPHCYTSAEELCFRPDLDIIFVLSSDEFHASHTITALQNHKHVFVEKPVSLSVASAERMRAAEIASGGRVFVAYMRRYASALQTLLSELKTAGDIKFARVRDIIGPNSFFVEQSGTFPEKFEDFPAGAIDERKALLDALLREAYEGHKEVTPLMTRFCRFLGGLGSHDLSVMREVLGMPKACTGVSMHPPFFTATFEYETFAVCYESGLDDVPRFDAHLQIYGQKKTLKLQYDTPYVKGLPVKVLVEEMTAEKGYQQREIVPTYEDAYTAELKQLHETITQGGEIKTTITDAMKDLEIFQMILKKAFPLDLC
ncbi:hypothetical protein V499_03274 [Pseudogymnoascus sp. VKM F-103]|nr:hypothetical protein V499_03274 [Pseudogymnoascus sp. VKM F-103]